MVEQLQKGDQCTQTQTGTPQYKLLVLPARIPSKTTKKTKQPINKTIHFGMMKNCNQAASRTQKPEMPIS